MTPLSQLKQKIVAVVPDLARTWMKHTCGKIPCPFPKDEQKEKCLEEQVEVKKTLGLADVLRALHLKKFTKSISITDGGLFVSDLWNWEEGEDVYFWNLSLPLDQQKPETIEFLNSLL